MSARSFLDTNILVYADDGDSPKKQERAIESSPDQAMEFVPGPPSGRRQGRQLEGRAG